MTSKKQHQMVYDFNTKFKVGEKVNLKLDNGEIKEVTIKHPATILGNHTAVGWFKEICGCYALSRVID